MIAQADRIAFSLYEVTAPAQIKGIQSAQAGIAAQITKAQALDTANMNLFTPSNNLINEYQNEYRYIDGNIRTQITEQNIVDSANKKLGNYFFPNNTSIDVPSLSTLGNIWPYINPFALTYGIGQNYTNGYGTQTPYESGTGGLISIIQAYTSLTPTATVIATVNSYITLANLEAAAILAISDPNSTNTTNNTAAYNYIENTLLPALNAYISFEVLTTLQAAVTARATFLSSARIPQLNTVLGTIVQSLTDGSITSSSGLYGQRYGFLALRLNALNGSLTIQAGLQAAYNAQTSIIANIQSTAATYYGILPTSAFLAPSTNTNIVQIADVSFLHAGDTAYIMADSQTELQLGVVSVVGNVVTLSGIVPTKYTSNVRIYEDLS